MSVVMASDTDTTEDAITRTADGVSAVAQLDDVNDRLLNLSEKITTCERVLEDLKALSNVLVRKSLQDVSLPSQQ